MTMLINIISSKPLYMYWLIAFRIFSAIVRSFILMKQFTEQNILQIFFTIFSEITRSEAEIIIK